MTIFKHTRTHKIYCYYDVMYLIRLHMSHLLALLPCSKVMNLDPGLRYFLHGVSIFVILFFRQSLAFPLKLEQKEAQLHCGAVGSFVSF